MNYPPPAPAKRGSTLKTVIAVILAVLFTCAVTVVWIVTGLFRSWSDPAGSMFPTIAANEQVWSRSWEDRPVRGQVFLASFTGTYHDVFVGRVVGMEGDVIAVDGPRVTINGWPIPSCDVGPWRDGTMVGTLRVEWLADATYLVLDDDASRTRRAARFELPHAQYWLVPDHRVNVTDPRSVAFASFVGRIHDDGPAAPSPALAGALASCLAKRPAVTTPPPPR